MDVIKDTEEFFAWLQAKLLRLAVQEREIKILRPPRKTKSGFIRKWKKAACLRKDLLKKISNSYGVYVPSETPIAFESITELVTIFEQIKKFAAELAEKEECLLRNTSNSISGETGNNLLEENKENLECKISSNNLPDATEVKFVSHLSKLVDTIERKISMLIENKEKKSSSPVYPKNFDLMDLDCEEFPSLKSIPLEVTKFSEIKSFDQRKIYVLYKVKARKEIYRYNDSRLIHYQLFENMASSIQLLPDCLHKSLLGTRLRITKSWYNKDKVHRQTKVLSARFKLVQKLLRKFELSDNKQRYENSMDFYFS